MDLSIIVINYNTKKITKDCLDSIVKNTKNLKYEIVVVDNASKDGSVEMLRKLVKKYPLRLIPNKKNLGFGKGNNQGIKLAKGKYILLLNTDTLINDNVLKEIVDWMEKHPKVGVSTCALRNADSSLQGTGGYFPNLSKVFAWMFFLEDLPFLDRLIKPFHPMHAQSPFYKGEGFFEKSHEQDWVTGAFLLTRRKVIDEVGFFDKDYFMYVEEVDYCWRVKKQGWQVWYLPRWSIVHLGGASSTAEFPILSELKGIKTFYKKHKPSYQMAILRVFLKAGMAVRVTIFGLMQGREAVKVYAKAFSQA
jgi:GT2 family glycosyltransferase